MRNGNGPYRTDGGRLALLHLDTGGPDVYACIADTRSERDPFRHAGTGVGKRRVSRSVRARVANRSDEPRLGNVETTGGVNLPQPPTGRPQQTDGCEPLVVAKVARTGTPGKYRRDGSQPDSHPGGTGMDVERTKRIYRPITDGEKRAVEVLTAIGLSATKVAAYLTGRLGIDTDRARVHNIRSAAGITAADKVPPPSPEALAEAMEILYGDALRAAMFRPAGEPEFQELAA